MSEIQNNISEAIFKINTSSGSGTGFYLKSKGYNVEKSFNKRVNILVYKDSMENNKKVEKALSKNIKVMSRDEFLELLK
jgi:NAD-dependent DNA ligase